MTKKSAYAHFTPVGPEHPASLPDTSTHDCLVFDLKEVDGALKKIESLLDGLELTEDGHLCAEARVVLRRQIIAFE